MDFLHVVGALTTQAAPSKTSKQVGPLNVLRFARPQTHCSVCEFCRLFWKPIRVTVIPSD